MTANHSQGTNYIYFEAEKKLNESAEIILPLDELDSNFNLSLIHSLAADINSNGNSTPKITK